MTYRNAGLFTSTLVNTDIIRHRTKVHRGSLDNIRRTSARSTILDERRKRAIGTLIQAVGHQRT